MKKIIISVVLIVTCVISYLILDCKLYYYGKNNLNLCKVLPLHIKPIFRYDFEGGFCLQDDFGFSLVSKGICQYVGTDIKLNIVQIIKYGFTDKELVAVVRDDKKEIYYIQFMRKNDVNSSQDMNINILKTSDTIDFEKYKWIDIEYNHFKQIKLIRNYSLLLLIGLLFMLLYFVIQKKEELMLGSVT